MSKRFNISESLNQETQKNLVVQDQNIKNTLDRVMDQVKEYMENSNESYNFLVKKCETAVEGSKEIQMQFVNTKDELNLLQQEFRNQDRTLQDLIVKADFIE